MEGSLRGWRVVRGGGGWSEGVEGGLSVWRVV